MTSLKTTCFVFIEREKVNVLCQQNWEFQRQHAKKKDLFNLLALTGALREGVQMKKTF